MIWVLCILGNLVAALSHEGVDWSPFEVTTTLDGEYSVDLIKALPIQQYWDVQKGSFRTGLLGEDMNKVFPQFTSFVERKVIRAGKNMGMDNHIVDTASLYMCSLSAIKQLASAGDELEMKISPYRSSSVEMSSQSSKTEIGDASIDELRAEAQAVAFQRSAHNYSQVRFLMDKENSLNRVNVRRTRQVAQYLAVHSALISEILSFLTHANDSNVQKFSALRDTVELMEATRYSQKEQALSKQHQENVLSFRRAINTTMEALAFRAAAELSAAHALRAFEEQQLLATKSELLQAEVEKVLETFFAEVSSHLLFVQSNPAVAFVIVRNGLIGVFLILLCFEVGQLILLIVKKLSGTSYLPRVRRLGAKSWWGGSSEEVPDPVGPLRWSCDTGPQLQKALHGLTVAIGSRLALPNLLVTGPAGSGKSSMSRAILDHIAQVAAASGAHVSCMVLCGADLQALGNGAATGFLNDLIRKYSCQRMRRANMWLETLVLVVDDADSIIAARSSANDTQLSNATHGSMNGSLFALLTGLRENSPFVSVILTSRLPVRAADGAILDRLDCCIELGLPSAEERLQYLLTGLAAIRKNAPSGGADSDATSAAVWREYDAMMASSGEPPSVAELLRGVPLAGLGAAHRQAIEGLTSQLSGAAAGASEDPLGDDEDATSISGSSCPEMDLPLPSATATSVGVPSRTRSRTVPGEAVSESAQCEHDALLAVLRRCALGISDRDGDASSTASAVPFRLSLCLPLALLVSVKWSYRDLKQFFSALNYAIMCNESCQISDRVWIQELIYSFN